MKQHIKAFYTGLISLLVTLCVSMPGVILLSLILGIFAKAVIWAFKMGFNLL